ncbi:uncharacterized protein LOC124807076 [Hydra vulgaris]|uniref:uncharacterized protein LOC124807076 n=1 Tax=Hydra vulgaris TaxID=6087 RepID=UPI000192612C|nr:pathogen-related protein-like [Hydra vulgaris]
MDKKIENENQGLKENIAFLLPDRGNLDDPSIKWRSGKPDYTRANSEFFKGKTMNHPEGSIEKFVEDLVKTWEMECSHKIDFQQWNTVNHETYCISANGGKKFSGEENLVEGNYNVLLNVCNPEFYDSKKEDFESSHVLFRSCFDNSFPWELLKVFSGPPKVVFTWRHWGTFSGTFMEQNGDNKLYEMYGFCIVKVNQDMKIESIDVYYKPDDFFKALLEKNPTLSGTNSIFGNGCPFASNA